MFPQLKSQTPQRYASLRSIFRRSADRQCGADPAIDIGPAASLPALGHVVKLTLTVDPYHTVAESSEPNNVGVITVDLTHITSPLGIHDTINCS